MNYTETESIRMLCDTREYYQDIQQYFSFLETRVMVIATNSDESQNVPMEKESNTGDKWENIPPSSFLHCFKPETI